MKNDDSMLLCSVSSVLRHASRHIFVQSRNKPWQVRLVLMLLLGVSPVSCCSVLTSATLAILHHLQKCHNQFRPCSSDSRPQFHLVVPRLVAYVDVLDYSVRPDAAAAVADVAAAVDVEWHNPASDMAEVGQIYARLYGRQLRPYLRQLCLPAPSFGFDHQRDVS